MKRSYEFKSAAMNALEGRWGWAILAGLVASAAGATTATNSAESVLSKYITKWLGLDGESDGLFSGFIEKLQLSGDLVMVLGFFQSILTFLSVFIAVYAVAQFIVGSIIEVGYCKFNLQCIDGERTQFLSLFKYFKNCGRIIVANILRTLYVVIGLFLFIIPGIIMDYSYAMVPYIMAENDSISANDALKLSKQIMRGNRWRLFCLEFSFIGWKLLSGLTLGLLDIWLNPFRYMAKADFYRELSATIIKNKDDIIKEEFSK